MLVRLGVSRYVLVRVNAGVFVGLGVDKGVLVRVNVGVLVGLGVGKGVLVRVAVGIVAVAVGRVAVGVGVGILYSITKAMDGSMDVFKPKYEISTTSTLFQLLPLSEEILRRCMAML